MLETTILKVFFRFWNMSFKTLLIFLFLGVFSEFFGQVKVGQWVDHTSYNSANSIAKIGSKVYVSNGAGLLTYDVNDNSLEKLTKIQGLSDIGVSLVRKNDYNNVLLILYTNTNIDILRPDGSIVNVSDIKRKSIPGKKYLNEVYFNGKYAYIAAGFGVVVFDTEKLEVKETFYIGNGVSNYEVYQITKNDTAFFAATEMGVFYGNKNKNLGNFQNWTLLNNGIASGPYNGVVNFDGKILANYSEKLKSNQSMKDTLYQYNGVVWSKFPYVSGSENKKLLDYSKYNKLLIIDQWGLKDFSNTGVVTVYITQYNSPTDESLISDACFENDGTFWLADKRSGFVKSKGGYPASNEKIVMNGPASNSTNDIDIYDGNLAVAPVGLGETYTYQYNNTPASFFKDHDWYSYKGIIPDTIADINCVVVNPKNKNQVMYGCMLQGIIDVRNNQLNAIYHSGNSPLSGINNGNDVRITGMNYDKNGNLWVGVTFAKKAIQIMKADNSWVQLDFEQFIVMPTITKIIFNKYNQAWIILARSGGLLVYNDVDGLTYPYAGNTKLLNVNPGQGFLPTNDVVSLCEDLDGHIWVGTAKGITVFYNPQNVFSGGNFDSQQILIEQDGHVQILLENDKITAITIDGANRKWIGTESSGVYCLSPDGQTQIHHFTSANSPLYSDVIIDLVVDETTGDVFIATDKGIQSYRTPIIKGYEEFTEVHAYPNPVRPGSNGPVYIKGLIDEAIVKITDTAGNLVWQTKSQGGQVEWNLSNLSGVRVGTGVYLVHCSSADGEKKASAKLMVVN